MERKKLLTSIIVVAAIGAGFLFIISEYGVTLLFALSREDIPSYEEIPDDAILNRTKDLPEVKAFLARYPTAWVFVDRVDHFSVHHQLTKSDLTGKPSQKEAQIEYIQPYLSLTVRLDSKGYPTSTVLWCTTDEHGQFKIENNILNKNNILEHLNKEICKLT